MTKPIILVKICYNIVSFKELQIFDKVTSWPQLISNFLVAPANLYKQDTKLTSKIQKFTLVITPIERAFIMHVVNSSHHIVAIHARKSPLLVYLFTTSGEALVSRGQTAFFRHKENEKSGLATRD